MVNIKKIFTPKVLSGMAIVGTFALAVVSAMEGMSAKEKIQEAKDTLPEEAQKNVMLKLGHYIPRVTPSFTKTIVLATGVVVCVAISSYMSGIQIAALTGTIGTLITQRNAVENEIIKIPGGKEALRKVKASVAQQQVVKAKAEDENKSPIKKLFGATSIEETGKGNLICYDHFSGRVFRSSQEAVEEAIDQFNKDREGDLPFKPDIPSEDDYPNPMSYNDLFRLFGIEGSQWGQYYGWGGSYEVSPVGPIPFVLTYCKHEDMDPTADKYGEDILMIEIDSDLAYPTECWEQF